MQNEWNGSAKVALISIRRSAAAWTLIKETTRDADAAAIVEHLLHLRKQVDLGFPDAWRFIRPGFDQSGL